MIVEQWNAGQEKWREGNAMDAGVFENNMDNFGQLARGSGATAPLM